MPCFGCGNPPARTRASRTAPVTVPKPPEVRRIRTTVGGVEKVLSAYPADRYHISRAATLAGTVLLTITEKAQPA